MPDVIKQKLFQKLKEKGNQILILPWKKIRHYQDDISYVSHSFS